MIPIIYPYKMGSKSGTKLAAALETRKVRPHGKYVPKRWHLIVSYGSNQIPGWAPVAEARGVEIINKWGPAVATAQNKLTAFRKMEAAGIPIPKYTDSKEVARTYFTQNRSVVFCRKLLNASGGRGIVIARSPEELVDAPLYTKYFPKTEEFRVHVFKRQVIDVAQKRRHRERAQAEGRNTFVRNLENGWIYAREGVNAPQPLLDTCVRACEVIGLDFGAVDCAIAADGTYCIFEINTAPGLEGTTLTKYAEAIKAYVRQQEQLKPHVQPRPIRRRRLNRIRRI